MKTTGMWKPALRALAIAAPIAVLAACGAGGDDGEMLDLGVKAVTPTFDTETGLLIKPSFVGKGDVQTALVWNNKQLQDNTTQTNYKVQFYISRPVTYSYTCQFEGTETIEIVIPNGPNAGTYYNEVPLIKNDRLTTPVASKLALGSEGRLKNQITGFWLDDEAAPQAGSGAPATGQSCSFEQDGVTYNGNIIGAVVTGAGTGAVEILVAAPEPVGGAPATLEADAVVIWSTPE
jgi:hypothetical protein